ncbi:MAG: FeoB-associated Cys-rich membrane protein [Clostridia bacterium]
MGTVVVGVILVGIVALIIRNMVRDKKSVNFNAVENARTAEATAENKKPAFEGVRNCQRIRNKAKIRDTKTRCRRI